MDGYRVPRDNPSAAAPTATPASGPYAHLPDPNPKLTLREVLEADELPSGELKWGEQTFAGPQGAKQGVLMQQEARRAHLNATPQEQRDIVNALAQIKAGGDVPFKGAVQAAPEGTTIDDLLDLKGQQPNKAQQYELGNLRVPAVDFPQFAAAQRSLCEKNPEALNLLYHMEHHQTKDPLTVMCRPAAELASGNAYSNTKNTIYWSPEIAVRDRETHNRTPPVTALLHEETHWAAGNLGEVLKQIPDKKFDNLEEKRVIQGAEARDLDKRGLHARGSHSGYNMRVRDVNSIDPEIVTINHGERPETRRAGFQQSGHLKAMNSDSLLMQTREHDPKSMMLIRKIDMSMAAGVSGENFDKLMRDAIDHNDKVTLHVHRDGVYYENRAQIDRWRTLETPTRNDIATRLAGELDHANIKPHDFTPAVGISK